MTPQLRARLAGHPLKVAFALWLALVAVYHADNSLVEEGDAVANVELPLSLLETGSPTFVPRNSPILFFWKSKAPLQVRDDYYVRSWFEQHAGRAAGVWHATGHLRFNGPRYFVTKAPRSDRYVSTFSVVPGLSFVPMVAALRSIDPDFPHNTSLRLSAARLYAASLVALSAALLFLIARRYASDATALFLALIYGVGTSAWSIASETLWQQTVNMALLTGGALAFLRALEPGARMRELVLAGLLFGTATASRPTAVFYLAAVAVYLLRDRRSALAQLAAGALPPLLAVALYNLHFFGTPFNFAQELVGHQIALEKTGSASLWQTPLLVGVLGQLVSPSRGLLVFSPFLALAFVGLPRLWRDPKYDALRPLSAAALLTMTVQAKWFDWWGGWAYGPRSWLETLPVLVLCMLPALDSVWRRWWTSALLVASILWACFVHGLGAFAYDKYWNARDLHVVVEDKGEEHFFLTAAEARDAAKREGARYTGLRACNIDVKECRYRLWSLDDNVISFYLQRWPISRQNRRHLAWDELNSSR